MRKIVTSHDDCPPIPYRSMDWSAHFDGDEERGEYGRGSTEDEAVGDLIDSYGEEETA